MSVLAIRHGFSAANNRDNYGTPAFGNPNAPLEQAGREQAVKLGKNLVERYGSRILEEPVAVSGMLRSQETAFYAGFNAVTAYPELNEEKGGLSDIEIKDAIETRNPPEAAIKAARFLIEHPLKEKIWITHALLIATMCQELGVYQDDDIRFTPKFCEIRELPIQLMDMKIKVKLALH